MRISRRQMLFNLGLASGTLSAAKLSAAQELVSPAPSAVDSAVWPAQMPSKVDRATERAHDVAESAAQRRGTVPVSGECLNPPTAGGSLSAERGGPASGKKRSFSRTHHFPLLIPQALLPPPYEFNAHDDQYESHLFPITLKNAGKHIISIRDEESGREFTSNVIVAAEQKPKHQLYFGDIHIHSQWSSDGRGDPDYSYIYARDAMNLDFACLTEHDPTDYIWGQDQGQGARVISAGTVCHAVGVRMDRAPHGGRPQERLLPGLGRAGAAFQFPSLSGPASPPAPLTFGQSCARVGKVGDEYHDHSAPSGIANFFVPWDHADPEFQRCVEIYSMWGNSEYPAGPRQIRTMGGSRVGSLCAGWLGGRAASGLRGGQRFLFRPSRLSRARTPLLRQRLYAVGGG